jgi:F-type H+-transporting ATPase subunit gamma
MSSAREMRLRIQSVANIAQVTRALQAVSASRIRRAQRAVLATRPYSDKAWQVLRHLSAQAGRDFIHPLLSERQEVANVLVVMISGDRGLAGAYNSNIVRFTLHTFSSTPVPVHYAVVGRKGRDMLARRGGRIAADFSRLPDPPSFADVSAVGRLAVDEYLQGRADRVYLAYTDFVNLLRQEPTYRQLLPLELHAPDVSDPSRARAAAPERHVAYTYEPSEARLIDQIVPRFTALQVFQAILESQASEHASRMVAMRNATENAHELVAALRLQYNKARQQAITSDMLDIAGGAEALAQVGQETG